LQRDSCGDDQSESFEMVHLLISFYCNSEWRDEELLLMDFMY